MTTAQIEQRRAAGRTGGRAVLAKYGREHMVRIGRRGGRPTWREALARAKARHPRPTAAGMLDGPRRGPAGAGATAHTSVPPSIRSTPRLKDSTLQPPAILSKGGIGQSAMIDANLWFKANPDLLDLWGSAFAYRSARGSPTFRVCVN